MPTPITWSSLSGAVPLVYHPFVPQPTPTTSFTWAPFDVIGVDVLSPVMVRLHFPSALATSDPRTLDPHNYQFTPQFGFALPIYAKSVAPSQDPNPANRTYVDVTLQDYMSDGGHYIATARGVVDINGNIY